MEDLKHREEKMKEKRKTTSWRDFLKEIGGRFPLILYKNDKMISIVPPTERIPIREHKLFEQERDNFVVQDDEKISDQKFFPQFFNLLQKIGISHNAQRGENENTKFSSIVINVKNSYLSQEVVESENIFYSLSVKSGCKDVYNSLSVIDSCSNIFQSVGVTRSYKIFYSQYIHDCSDIRFSTNLQGCHECIFAHDKQNVSYCIGEDIFPQEEYFQKKKELLAQKNMFATWDNKVGGEANFGSKESSGQYITESDHMENGLFAYHMYQSRNCIFTGSTDGNTHFYDVIKAGVWRSSDYYAVLGAGQVNNLFCSMEVLGGQNVYYSYFLNDCSYCLGCIGLKNKSFCILNKQYTKDERFALADKIFAQMEADGTLGAFFPGWMNPFYFNDTAAYLIDDSFTKEEVTKEGYLRREEEIKVDVPTGAEVVTTNDLTNYQGFDSHGEWVISSEILKKVIKDEKGNYYRIVPMELEFLQKHGLPLPEIHWLERIKLGFKFK